MSDPKLTGKAKAIGLRWLEDSSLEQWFPFSAKELAALRAEREELRQALQWLLDARSRTATEVLAATDNARAVLAKGKGKE